MSFDKYEHKNVENKIYDYWEKKELFKPKENSNFADPRWEQLKSLKK